MSQKLRRIDNFCLITLTAIFLTMALIYAKVILVPLFISFCVFALLGPLTLKIQKILKIPYGLAMGVVFLFFVILIFIMTLLMMGSIERFAQEASVYGKQIEKAVEPLDEWLLERDFDIQSNFFIDYISDLPVLKTARSVTGWLMGLVSQIFLITIFVLFLLAGQKKGGKQMQPALYHEIQSKISKYLVLKFSTSLTTGVLVGVILTFFSVDLAIMFAILTVLLNFIPSVGSIIATLLPVPVLFFQYGLGWQFVCILVLISLVQLLIGNIIEPKLMGDSMGLHPITILGFLVFWGLAWGVAGMFLAVPITVILKIILQKVEPTRPVAELMAGRW